MAEPLVLFERDDRTAIITINRPDKRNSFTEATRRELIDHWIAFREDPDLDVAILTGAGDVSFSAGSDLREIARGIEADASWVSPVRGLSSIALAGMQGLNINKPVIAAVNGYCLGAAFAVALACDIRLASPNAVFSAAEVKYGHMAGGGQATRLARMLPFGWALELCLTGDRIDAETALRIGVINRIVPQDKLLDEARALAGRMIECGPTVVRETKEFMYRSLGLPLNEALHLEGLYYERIRRTRDYDEGTTAFAERRRPVFERR